MTWGPGPFGDSHLEPAGYGCPSCEFEATSDADLRDHRLIRSYTDPDRHGEATR